VDPATGNRSVVSGCLNAACSSARGIGPALDKLFGITVEETGNVVVANSRALLRIDPQTGNRTVLSGCPDASCATAVGSGPNFGRPEEIERDGLGHFLVVDGDRDAPQFRAIFRVDATTGDRTIVSGCADAACSSTVGTGPLFSGGLIGLALDTSGNLVVSDGVQRALFRVDSQSGNRSVFSGCADASCTSVVASGTHPTDPLGLTALPEPDPRLGLGAGSVLLAALVRRRRTQ